jgi:hypothetical protein
MGGMVGMKTAQADHGTDLYKLKERFGDRACIQGDLPPAMPFHGTPDEVCKLPHQTDQRHEAGSRLVPSSSRTIPDIARLENVKGINCAATGE